MLRATLASKEPLLPMPGAFSTSQYNFSKIIIYNINIANNNIMKTRTDKVTKYVLCCSKYHQRITADFGPD